MLLSLLFFLCIALNTCLIWFFLCRPLRAVVAGFGTGLLRTRRYLTQPLGETRERALRRRTLLLLRQLGLLILGCAAVVLCYSPSMLFAHYRYGLSAAFVSPEALAGMLAAAAAIAWFGRGR